MHLTSTYRDKMNFVLPNTQSSDDSPYDKYLMTLNIRHAAPESCSTIITSANLVHHSHLLYASCSSVDQTQCINKTKIHNFSLTSQQINHSKKCIQHQNFVIFSSFHTYNNIWKTSSFHFIQSSFPLPLKSAQYKTLIRKTQITRQ